MDEIVERKVENSLIPHRLTDGYINATVLCQACGKLVADYLRLATTSAFLQALSETMGITIVSLVQVKTGRNGGTWVHPQVAINLGQWCSPRFAVLVSQWVVDWMQGKRPSIPNREPVYVKRLSLAYKMQMGVPEGYWTVFDKCSNLLILVECDLKLPVDRYDLLDGSVGKRYSAFREGQPWAMDRIQYAHIFPDKRGVQMAWAYRLEELPHFERWQRGIYIPQFLGPYLDRKYEMPMPVAQLIAQATRMPAFGPANQ